MPEPASKTLFYGVAIASHATSARGTALAWSPPFDRPGRAKAWCRAKMAVGDATLGFVVAIGPQGRDVLHSYTVPEGARKVVLHLIEVEDALDAHAPGQGGGRA